MSEVGQQRRAGDGAPKDPTLGDVYALLLVIQSDQHTLRADHDAMQGAFLLDDLKKPDYADHRKRLKAEVDAEQLNAKFKRTLTERVLLFAASGVGLFLLVAALNSCLNYLSTHLVIQGTK